MPQRITELAVDSAEAQELEGFNTRFHYCPSAIIYPAQTSGVSKAVKCAVQFGVPVSALSGGHSFTASGYGSQNGTLVIVFCDMAQINYRSSDKTASVQPGARFGDVALELNKNGRAMAHGAADGVGIGGHTGFDRWGPLSRNWGFLIDQVESAVLVLADGAVVEVGKTQIRIYFGWASLGLRHVLALA
ncbi:hypothetical protein C8R44DRAFT_877406 [Mycena epipterygia]|nr:hypothetical protein C8R44DRAFT_877406 [Mycena epipterygia]